MSKKTVVSTLVITNQAEFSKAVLSIKNRGAKLDADIQAVGLASLKQAGNGNTNWANELLSALPKSARTVALKEWFLAHGPLVMNLNKEEVKQGKHFSYDKTKALKLELAEENAWFTFKPDTEVKPFDAQAAVARLMSTLINNVGMDEATQARIQEHTKAIQAILAGAAATSTTDAE